MRFAQRPAQTRVWTASTHLAEANAVEALAVSGAIVRAGRIRVQVKHGEFEEIVEQFVRAT